MFRGLDGNEDRADDVCEAVENMLEADWEVIESLELLAETDPRGVSEGGSIAGSRGLFCAVAGDVEERLTVSAAEVLELTSAVG